MRARSTDGGNAKFVHFLVGKPQGKR